VVWHHFCIIVPLPFQVLLLLISTIGEGHHLNMLLQAQGRIAQVYHQLLDPVQTAKPKGQVLVTFLYGAQ